MGYDRHPQGIPWRANPHLSPGPQAHICICMFHPASELQDYRRSQPSIQTRSPTPRQRLTSCSLISLAARAHSPMSGPTFLRPFRSHVVTRKSAPSSPLPGNLAKGDFPYHSVSWRPRFASRIRSPRQSAAAPSGERSPSHVPQSLYPIQSATGSVFGFLANFSRSCSARPRQLRCYCPRACGVPDKADALSRRAFPPTLPCLAVNSQTGFPYRSKLP